MGYVSVDGNYGSDDAMLFENEALTREQWEILDSLSDFDKYDYVTAIIEGGDLSKYES